MTDVINIDERERARKEALLKAIGLDKVPEEQRELALAIAKRYELDLLLKHLVLIDGRPYITRDGELWVAHRSGQLDGIEVSDAVVVDIEGMGKFWKASCSVYRKDMSRPFTYTGRYPVAGQNKRFGPEMAVKVAEVMALRRAFNISAPVFEERWDIDAAVTEPEPRPDLADVVSARKAEITSGPVPLADGSAAVLGSQGQDEAGDDSDIGGPPAPVDEPPHPANHAGARAATSGQNHPSGGTGDSPSSADTGEPTPAPFHRCEGFHGDKGACVRPDGHEGNHSNKDRETWG